MKQRILYWVIVVALGLAGDPLPGRAVELLSNGGFESGWWEWTPAWGKANLERVTLPGRPGSCLHFEGRGALQSIRFAWNQGAIVVRGAYKVRGVQVGDRPWHALWLTVAFMDAEGKKLRHGQVLIAKGEKDWTQFETNVVPPAGTRIFRVHLGFMGASGEAWLDDMQVVADAGYAMPVWRLTGEPFYNGVLYPTPKKVKYDDRRIEVYDAAGRSSTLDVRTAQDAPPAVRWGRQLIQERIRNGARIYRVKETPANTATTRIVVHLYTRRQAEAGELARDFSLPELVEPLPPRGYRVRTRDREGGLHLLAVGEDERGALYAAVSILQMIGIEKNRLVLRTFETTDWPTYRMRSADELSLVDEDRLRRLPLYKINVFASQFRFYWRDFLPDKKQHYGRNTVGQALERMARFREQTHALDYVLMLHIYAASPKDKRPIFNIADDENIRELARRMRLAYRFGIQTIMISVDDWTPREKDPDGKPRYVCSTKAEKARFGSVGRAHGVLMQRLEQELRRDCPELRLLFCPAVYSLQHVARMANGAQYLRDLGKALPPNVPITWTGPRIVSYQVAKEDFETFSKLTGGHALQLWDNAVAQHPIFPYFDGSFYKGFERDNAWGFVWINPYAFGWYWHLGYTLTLNDYLWNREAYAPDRVYRNVLEKAYGPDAVPDVTAVNHAFESVGRAIRGKRPEADWMQTQLSTLWAAMDKLAAKGYPTRRPRRALTARGITPDMPERLRRIPRTVVPLFDVAPKLDGDLADPCWKRTVELGPFTNIKTRKADGTGGEIPKARGTTCRIGRDETALYIAFVCHNDRTLKVPVFTEKRDAPVYSASDAVELFFDPDPAENSPYHIVIDHAGNVFDEGPDDGVRWNGDFQFAIRKEVAVWRIEVRVPLTTLTVKRGKRAPWRANFCRSFSQAKEFSAWAPTYGSFLNRAYFGKVSF